MFFTHAFSFNSDNDHIAKCCYLLYIMDKETDFSQGHRIGRIHITSRILDISLIHYV